MSKRKELRRLLNAKEILVTPGAFDALTAKLIEEAEFKAVYATGAGIANSQFCFPDIGLTTGTEILEQVRRIVGATEKPVIADIDTGYGNFLNVTRTVKEFEKVGVAGLQIEDQVFPKRCGHFDGKEIITRDEMVSKVKASVDSRDDQDLVIIARTDARAVSGPEEAIERAQLYIEAGADAVFVEAPETKAEMVQIARQIRAPKVVNMVEGGKTPLCTAEELESMGYSMVIYANSVLRASVQAIKELLRHLNAHGCTIDYLDKIITMDERNRITGVDKAYELEKRYHPKK
jgi:methylisocitrate lyase